MNLFHKADKAGQKKVKDTIKVLFSGCTLTRDEHIEDSGYIDIYITATTATNTSITYAIEAKDRDMPHTKYAEEGYILEDWKKKKLEEASKQGYRPLYINTFTDNKMIVWNLNKIDYSKCGETGERIFHKTTVMKSNNDLYKKNKITLKNSQAVWIGDISIQ